MIQKHTYLARSNGGQTVYQVTDVSLFGFILVYRGRSLIR